MLVWVWVRDDETGLLDDEFKDGDIFQVAEDSFEGSIGGIEKRTFLIFKMPDPANLSKVMSDIVKTEYAPGSSLDAPPVVRRKRAYNINWRSLFTADEIAQIEDASQVFPDGPLSGGGSVVSGVFYDKAQLSDFRRK